MRPVQRIRVPLAVEKACPCKGCEDRELGCHGRCGRYAEWRAKADEERAKQIEAAKLDAMHMDFFMDSRDKCIKAHGTRGNKRKAP